MDYRNILSGDFILRYLPKFSLSRNSDFSVFKFRSFSLKIRPFRLKNLHSFPVKFKFFSLKILILFLSIITVTNFEFSVSSHFNIYKNVIKKNGYHFKQGKDYLYISLF